ncbi:MAG: SDR family NAD(P)-dependent oxidoreductase, partial [Bacteroidota bacterium]
ASSGIGRGFAQALAARGLNLVLVARREGALRQLAETLPTETRVVPADLASSDGLDTVERETADLDVGLLVAAAGFGTSGPFADSDLAVESAMLDVNVGAVLRQSHHFGGRFAARGRGGIVLLGSLVGFQGTPYAAHYAATKAYVQTLAEALYVEMKPRGVDVLSVAPGPVATGFADVAGMRMGATVPIPTVVEQSLRALGRKQTVRPGLLTKVLLAGLRSVPRSGSVRIMERVMGGMTQHQRTA